MDWILDVSELVDLSYRHQRAFCQCCKKQTFICKKFKYQEVNTHFGGSSISPRVN